MINKNVQVSAILLAAGSSIRMNGPNKLLLPYKGKTIIETVVDNLLPTDLKEIIVVVGFEMEKVKKLLKSRNVTIIENPDHLKGMSTGISKGVSVASGDGYMICLSDMVNLLPTDYNNIIKSFQINFIKNNQTIVVPFYKEQKGNPILFSSTYKNEIINNDHPEGCRNLVKKNSHNIVAVDFENENILNDIDSPGDYQSLIN